MPLRWRACRKSAVARGNRGAVSIRARPIPFFFPVVKRSLIKNTVFPPCSSHHGATEMAHNVLRPSRLAARVAWRSSLPVPQLAPELIDQINAANDIVEVVGGYFPLKHAGAMWKALCPFHQERTPSFTVNPQRQIFKCFGCGAGGGPIRFVMMYEHLGF